MHLLGVSFLQQRRPKLVRLSRVQKDESSVVSRQQIVDNHIHPAAVLPEPDKKQKLCTMPSMNGFSLRPAHTETVPSWLATVKARHSLTNVTNILIMDSATNVNRNDTKAKPNKRSQVCIFSVQNLLHSAIQ